MRGALGVEPPAGRRLTLGRVYPAAQRADPPAVGSVVTYRHRGLSDRGLPRFATFVRVRQDRLRP